VADRHMHIHMSLVWSCYPWEETASMPVVSQRRSGIDVKSALDLRLIMFEIENQPYIDSDLYCLVQERGES